MSTPSQDTDDPSSRQHYSLEWQTNVKAETVDGSTQYKRRARARLIPPTEDAKRLTSGQEAQWMGIVAKSLEVAEHMRSTNPNVTNSNESKEEGAWSAIVRQITSCVPAFDVLDSLAGSSLPSCYPTDRVLGLCRGSWNGEAESSAIPFNEGDPLSWVFPTPEPFLTERRMNKTVDASKMFSIWQMLPQLSAAQVTIMFSQPSGWVRRVTPQGSRLPAVSMVCSEVHKLFKAESEGTRLE
ncbi:hypothetical protein JCM24511_01311 [Saitozyma sp. JCM 24511]|nr:hypothetical protein JCM24511_01311 [Saitozyma sp. JCM 24511]